MRQFKSWEDYSNFERAVKQNYRYIRDKEGQDFLETVLATAEKRIETTPEGTKFCRAQIGHESRPIFQEGEYIGDEPVPFGPERMKPLKNCAFGGRANPKGIPYLYVATSIEIAIAEVRPWIGSMVSVAGLRTARPLRIVNCTFHKYGRLFAQIDENAPAEYKEEAVWWGIDKAFQNPVTIADNTDDYAPTQTIAELFKINGLDGLAYKSAFDDPEKQKEYNLVFFDIDALDVVNVGLREIKNIKFESDRLS